MVFDFSTFNSSQDGCGKNAEIIIKGIGKFLWT